MNNQPHNQRGFSLSVIARKVRQRGITWGVKRALFRIYLLLTFPLRIVRRLLAKMGEYLGPLKARLWHGDRLDSRLTFWNRLAWELHPHVVRMVALFTGKWRRDPGFVANGYRQGLLPSEMVELLQKTIGRIPEKPVIQDAYYEGYLHHNRMREADDLEGKVNRSHKFVDIECCPEEVLSSLVHILQGPVARCLGTNWRILNVKCWKTAPAALTVAMNDWHEDGMPLSALKVMIYLSGASKALGTTEMRMPDGSTTVVDGPPGTWLFFRNSVIRHRGLAPTQGVRTLLELTIGPAFRQHYRPRFGGMNAMYPVYPWSEPRPRHAAKQPSDAAKAA
jgi:hypothetical protein